LFRPQFRYVLQPHAARGVGAARWQIMFTGVAILIGCLLVWYAGRSNEKNRPQYDNLPPEDQLWLVTLHARQDLKLIAFLLLGIMVMLGIIADKLK
jgi:hypothetical protein